MNSLIGFMLRQREITISKYIDIQRAQDKISRNKIFNSKNTLDDNLYEYKKNQHNNAAQKADK